MSPRALGPRPGQRQIQGQGQVQPQGQRHGQTDTVTDPDTDTVTDTGSATVTAPARRDLAVFTPLTVLVGSATLESKVARLLLSRIGPGRDALASRIGLRA